MEITLKKEDSKIIILGGNDKDSSYIFTSLFTPFPKTMRDSKMSYGELPTELSKEVMKYIEEGYTISLMFN